MASHASKNKQSGCIISDAEMEMALQRMVREQFGNAEPATQAWQKLRGSIIATQPVDPHLEVTPRLANVRLAWLNMFVPRILQTALALVIMLATVLSNGANLGGLMVHQSTGYVQTAPSGGQVLDDRTQDPPVMKTLPNLNQPAEQPATDNAGQGSNTVYPYERVRNELHPATVSYENPAVRVGDYYLH